MFYYKMQNSEIIKLEMHESEAFGMPETPFPCIPDSVYEPREDSLLLAKVLEEELESGKAKKEKIKSALEIGCGSGLLSIIAAKRGCEVLAADINPAAVACAKRNAGLNNADIKAVQSDLFRQVRGKFDLIVFNPPYLPEEQTESSRAWAGGKNLEIISRFIMQAKRFLSRSGEMLIVVSSLSKPEKILKEFSESGFSAKIIAERKIPWEKLFAVCAKLSD